MLLQEEMLKYINMATISMSWGLSKGLVPKLDTQLNNEKLPSVSLLSDLFNKPLEQQMLCKIQTQTEDGADRHREEEMQMEVRMK